MSRSIPCRRCGGQAFAEHDGDGAVQLTCLQCSRPVQVLDPQTAKGLGMPELAWDLIVEHDWSCMVWDDDAPSVFIEDGNEEEAA